MRGKKLLAAFLLGVGLCFVPALGYGEVSRNIKEGYVDYASYNRVRFLEARVDYIMRNPSSFLDVKFAYDLDGNIGRIVYELPDGVDTKGKILITINDNRNAFSYTTSSPRKLDCLKDFPLPPDAEVASEDKPGFDGLLFWTKQLADSDTAFHFYGQWLSAEGWERLSLDEASWLETYLPFYFLSPTTYLVHQIWQKDEVTLVIFPSHYNKEGDLGIDVKAVIRPRVVLDEFKRELKTIYKSIRIPASDMNTDVVAIFRRGVTFLGYFYQGEYHLWEE